MHSIWNSKLKKPEILTCHSGFVLFFLVKSFAKIQLIWALIGHCVLLFQA